MKFFLPVAFALLLLTGCETAEETADDVYEAEMNGEDWTGRKVIGNDDLNDPMNPNSPLNPNNPANPNSPMNPANPNNFANPAYLK